MEIKMRKGILYGIGVGPGDPELMTLKAVNTILRCDLIAVPHENKDKCMALRIALGAVPELENREILEIHMPMTKDPEALESAYEAGAEVLCRCLREGKTLGFLTIGDPTVYATYMYLHQKVLAAGFEAKIIPGVPSFCAAAAAINEPLCLGEEQLHVIPGSYGPEEALAYPGVKVIMKGVTPGLRSALIQKKAKVSMVEKCGLPEEKIYRGLENLPEDKGYFRLMIVRDGDC